MAQLQSPSRASSGPCPLFCPILISSHVIRHLGVNARLQPPSNCQVEVPLHIYHQIIIFLVIFSSHLRTEFYLKSDDFTNILCSHAAGLQLEVEMLWLH